LENLPDELWSETVPGAPRRTVRMIAGHLHNKRVKRISSGNKSGPFVGSEFAYEDLVSQEVDKYEYRWLRDEHRPMPVPPHTPSSPG
jgi:hypothetical protein